MAEQTVGGGDEVAWQAAALRARAAVLDDRAARARALAWSLARRREALAARLDPVRGRHVGATWTSAAATRSRRVLDDEVAFGVWLAVQDLTETIRDLSAAAGDWDAAASITRREADTAIGDTVRPA